MNSKLIDEIVSLIPMLRSNALEAERRRKPVDEVFQALCDTGVFKAFVPAHFGGYELDLPSFMKIGIELGRGCVSTAWVTTFCMEHNWLLAQFSQSAQEEIFGTQPYIIAPGTISPTGTATPDGDGFILNGRWKWATGVMHADWVLLSGMVENAGFPDLRMFILPIDQVDVIDTWYIDGMVGTGSNDIQVNSVYVPEHRAESVMQMAIGRGRGSVWHDRDIFKIPMLPFKCITAAAPAVGAAIEAVHLFETRIRERTLFGSSAKQQDNPAAQMRLGRLNVRALWVEQQIIDLAQAIQQAGCEAQACPPRKRAEYRLTAAMIVHECRNIVRDVVEASGASAHFLDHPLQRIHRDVHTLACHAVFDLDTASELYGRSRLGLEVKGLV
ncbi:MAG: acyl-CoA dehydrogenase family protein [Proteobacteria bacterium]|nr:acyl-CoA dehydrogenase family protein [Pseudomonadota bacterium]